MSLMPDNSVSRASVVPNDRSSIPFPLLLYAVLPTVLLLTGALAARLLLREPGHGTQKIALIHAFAGPLQTEGYDALTASRAGVRAENAGLPLYHGFRFVVEALDDSGTVEGATTAQRALAHDPSILRVICCSTQTVTHAMQLLPLAAQGDATRTAWPLVDHAPPSSYFVDTAVRILHTDHPVLIQSRASTRSRAAMNVLDTWPGTPIITYVPEQGDLPDVVASTVAGITPDVLMLDLDVASVARLLGPLRAMGVMAPAIGPPDIGSATLVNWLGDRLGQVYVPAITPNTIPDDLMKATMAERGHAPSAPDVVIYWTVRRAIAEAVGDSTTRTDLVEPTWVMERLDPGKFPGTVVSMPP